LINLQNSFTATLYEQFCDKTIIKDFNTQTASLHYLVKYKFSKIAPTDAQQQQTIYQLKKI